jgi:hypothetical protein
VVLSAASEVSALKAKAKSAADAYVYDGLQHPRQSRYRAPGSVIGQVVPTFHNNAHMENRAQEFRQDLPYTSSVDVYSLGIVLLECIST